MSYFFTSDTITAEDLNSLSMFDAVVSQNHGEVGNVYSTIDDAIDAGASSIFVKAGTYDGFTLDENNVFILGEPPVLTNNYQTGGVVIEGTVPITGNGVRLSGLTFHPDGTNDCITISGTIVWITECKFIGGETGSDLYCIDIPSAGTTNRIWIVNNEFRDTSGYGSIRTESSKIIISGNHIIDNTGVGIIVGIDGESGADYIVIIDNIIKDNGTYGVYIGDANSNNTALMNNVISGHTTNIGGASTIIPATAGNGNLIS